MMTTPPVILQILPSLNQGGVERGTVDMARAIMDAGGKALVMSSGGAMVDTLKNTGAQHIVAPLHHKNPFHIWRNIALIRQVIEEHSVHIVHARSRAPAWSAYYATRQKPAHFITTFHGTYASANVFKKRYNSIMAKGEAVIAVSHHIREHILANYDCKAEQLHVIPRGVNLAQFSEDAIHQARLIGLIQSWHLEETHKPIIFFPGRITRWKGQHIALEALARLGHKNFICLFAGDNDKHMRYVRELHEQVNRLGLERNVRFVSSTAHMAEAYYLSTVVICPSLEPEAFGRIPIEAGAMQRITIASNHGGARETIRDNETGFLVEPANAAMLADTIQYVLDMEGEQRAQIGAAARTYIADHYSLTNMQNATLDVYENIMRHRKGS